MLPRLNLLFLSNSDPRSKHFNTKAHWNRNSWVLQGKAFVPEPYSVLELYMYNHQTPFLQCYDQTLRPVHAHQTPYLPIELCPQTLCIEIYAHLSHTLPTELCPQPFYILSCNLCYVEESLPLFSFRDWPLQIKLTEDRLLERKFTLCLYERVTEKKVKTQRNA